METKRPNKKPVLYIGFGILILLALVLRFTLLKFRSEDYTLDVGPWYDFLKLHGIHGLGSNFSNYNLPYLYLLYIATLIPIHQIAAIKGISIFFDLLLSYGVFMIVRHFNPKNYLPHLAAIITLFLPTVFINSSMWGQSDSSYTAFIVLSFYFALKKHYNYMWVMWALSFAFKLQAVFFLPLLIIVSMKNRAWLKSWVFVPVMLVTIIPALLLGRPVSSILGIYTNQVGFYHALTLHAPNLYQWIPNTLYSYFNGAGIVLTTSIIILVLLLTYYYQKFSDKELVLLATLILLVVPFFLPQMHERYFYPAEIFCLIAAFTYRPVIWYAPLMQFITLCAYTPFLFNAKPVLPLGIVAILVLIIICHLTYQLFIKDDRPITILKHTTSPRPQRSSLTRSR